MGLGGVNQKEMDRALLFYFFKYFTSVCGKLCSLYAQLTKWQNNGPRYTNILKNSVVFP